LPQIGDAYRLGSEEEAAYAVTCLGPAAMEHPEVIRWMDQINRKLV
jgi:hypothetical protein